MKLLIYTETAVQYERLKRVLSPHIALEFHHLDEAHNTKLRIFPYAMDTSLALVDCDANPEGAMHFASQLHQLLGQGGRTSPLIALSSSSEVSFLKQMMEAGCSDFIRKPFEDINLITRLQKALSQQMIVDPGGYLKGDTAPTEPQVAIEMPTSVPLEWHPDFSVGVPEIDEDHKQIIEHYRKLYLSMRAGGGHKDYEDHIMFLMDYVKAHFAREEDLQRSHHYEDFERHQKMHAAFTQRVEALIGENAGKTVTHGDLIRLNLFIKEWLIRHILVEDRKIGQALKLRGSSKS